MLHSTIAAGWTRRATRPFTALIIVVLAAACLPGWREQVVVLEGPALEDIACADAQHCWAVGSEGARAAVLATTDGQQWTRQTTGVSGGGLRAVSCWTGGHCAAVGGSTVLQTSDGGATWTSRAPATPVDLADVSCTPAGRCVAAGRSGAQGENGALAVSADGGATWSAVASPVLAGAPLTSVDCPDDGCLAVTATRPAQVLASTDGGASWTLRASMDRFSPFTYVRGKAELTAVDCLPGGTCVATGLEHVAISKLLIAYRTTDWGATWRPFYGFSRDTNSVPDAVTCADADNCWIGASSDTGSTIWAHGAFSDPNVGFYAQYSGIDGPHAVTGFACADRYRCTAVARTPTGSRIFATPNGGAAMPVLTRMTPDHGPSAGGTTVTMTGRGFTNTTAVRFGAATAPSFTVLADDRLVVTTPAAAGDEPHVTVTVETSDGNATTNRTFFYEFPLHLTSMEPNRCAFGPGCGPLRFEGTGLPLTAQRQDVARVRFGTIDLTPDCQSTTECSVYVPEPQVHPELVNTVVPVTFETAGGRQTFEFTYGPVVSSVSPLDGPPGGGHVTITGLGLGATTALRWGTTSVPFTVVDDTRLTTTVPPGAANTQVGLSLTNPLGDWTLGAPDGHPAVGAFTYLPRPTITGLVPPRGPEGTTIELRGTGLPLRIPTRAVRFGTAVASDVVCHSELQVTTGETCRVTVPPGTGTVPVTIETGGGTSPVTPATMFTYTRPVLTGVSPRSGPAAGGNIVVIEGRNLVDVLAVGMGATWPVPILSATETEIRIIAPPGTPGSTVWISVTTKNGVPVEPANGLTYRYV